MDSLQLLCTEQCLNNNSGNNEEEEQEEDEEELEETLTLFMEKEVSYMPQILQHHPAPAPAACSNHVNISRFKSICWIITCQRRLNLSPETVFCAANYLDRFISLNLCQSWKEYWKFRLLAVACLSVASKYNDTIPPPPYSFSHFLLQMDDDDDWWYYTRFESSVIKGMELTLLKALEWRLGPITSYSYLHIFLSIHRDDQTAVTQLLLNALLDDKFIEFRPSVVAIAAVEYLIYKELFILFTSTSLLNNFRSLIRKYINEDDISKCYKMMEESDLGGGGGGGRSICSSFPPSSPVTVLETRKYQNDFHEVGRRNYLLKRRKTMTIELDFSTSGQEIGKKLRDDEDQEQHDHGEFFGIIG